MGVTTHPRRTSSILFFLISFHICSCFLIDRCIVCCFTKLLVSHSKIMAECVKKKGKVVGLRSTMRPIQMEINLKPWREWRDVVDFRWNSKDTHLGSGSKQEHTYLLANWEAESKCKSNESFDRTGTWSCASIWATGRWCCARCSRSASASGTASWRSATVRTAGCVSTTTRTWPPPRPASTRRSTSTPTPSSAPSRPTCPPPGNHSRCVVKPL